MKLSFDAAPFSDGIPRPVAQVRVAGVAYVVPALIDSGAVGNRFSSDIADDAGLDRSSGATLETTVGGKRYFGHLLDVSLEIGQFEWQAPVAFMEDWNLQHQLLGLTGFFDRFDVRIRGAARTVTIMRPAP